MPLKRILCLAFSRREGGHCFAGIDIVTGTWIRPISKSGRGGLYYHECLVRQLDNKFVEPRVLDVIELNLVSPEPKLGQPENWLLGEGQWTVVGRSTLQGLSASISAEPELFRGYERFVDASEIANRPPIYSLVLVRPENLAWYAEPNRYGKKRMVGIFSIYGSTYSLPLTDDAYAHTLDDIKLFERRSHDPSIPILFTLSLGDVWAETHRHYKLIAGVVT